MIRIKLKLDDKLYRKTENKVGQVVNGKRRALDRRLTYYRQELPFDAARSFRDYIADIIMMQDESYMVGFAPLSYDYFDRKGGDGRFWEYTGKTLYRLQSSPIYQNKNSATYTAFTLGLPPKTLDIIKFMEYGTRNMPARPLFAAAFRRFSISFYRQTGTYMRDLLKVWRES